jgi:hypothetical protein
MKDFLSVLFLLYLVGAGGVYICLHDAPTALLWPVLAVRSPARLRDSLLLLWCVARFYYARPFG